MKLKTLLSLSLLVLVPFASHAKVSAEEAARLGKDLTPVGAERAGNAEGSITPWDGGLTSAPPCFGGAGSRYCDPFPQDKPLFTITAANLGAYKSRLAIGQLALFARYRDYKMNVYATRRTFANPKYVYDATLKNATRVDLVSNGEGIAGAVTGVPFPLPRSALELIWNHKLRFHGASSQRWNNQFAVTGRGSYTQIKRYEDVRVAYSQPGITPDSLKNVFAYLLERTVAPPRLAGGITLVHETLDQWSEPRRVWQYNPGQRRLRRAPNVAYDNPAMGADGLRTNDQFDMFNGATDRYDWRLVGKRELFVAVNSYRLHSDHLKYDEIIKTNHLNQDFPRYELRRVWVVESALRNATSHIYKRRTYYIDEDGYQIRFVEAYDNRDELWRVQEAHSVIAYDAPYELPVCETVYDVLNNRYLVQVLNNEEPEVKLMDFPADHFEPSSVTRQATK